MSIEKPREKNLAESLLAISGSGWSSIRRSKPFSDMLASYKNVIPCLGIQGKSQGSVRELGDSVERLEECSGARACTFGELGAREHAGGAQTSVRLYSSEEGINPKGIDPSVEIKAGIDPKGIDPYAEFKVGIDPKGIDPCAEFKVGIDPKGIDPSAEIKVGIDPKGMDPSAEFKVGIDPKGIDPCAEIKVGIDPKGIDPSAKIKVAWDALQNENACKK
ncbi:hypothetical protein CRG98_007327 [Punica granatum]|uniref:Uncharacterized protein n=1 Tax=Punica granatum TaxID=22663 RepID=A0A2I0KV79_PUNGR|nr:hypothetical protein CRG98_007327 [Punica granatum]